MADSQAAGSAGNVFDDAAETSLADALASDEFKATAGADDLGVDRVLFGWGEVAEVAPGYGST